MRKSSLSSAALAALALSACGAPESATEAAIGSNQQAPALADIVRANGLTEIAPDRYVYEGDMVLTGAQVQRFLGGSHGALIVGRFTDGSRDVWPVAARGDIRYCVSDNFGADKAKIVAGMDRATRAWVREAGVGATFRYVPSEDANCNTSNIAINVPVQLNPSIPTATYANSSIGPNVVVGDRGMGYIDVSTSGARLGESTTGVDLKAVLTHEVGHILGFFHEHDHPAALASGCGGGSFDANHEILTPYDPTSVMHYTRREDARCPDVSYQWLSVNDKQAARQVYPGGAVTENACFHRTYPRGAGTVPDTCNGDRQGALCYARCAAGYTGVLSTCWQLCPSGYIDDGAFCRRPFPLHIFAKSSYTRGTSSLSCRAGLQMDAGLCYQPCAAGFNGVGPVCHEGC